MIPTIARSVPKGSLEDAAGGRVKGTFNVSQLTEVTILRDAEIGLFNVDNIIGKVADDVRTGNVVRGEDGIGLLLSGVGAPNPVFP